MASTQLILRYPKATSVSKIAVRLCDGRDFRIVISSEYSVKPKHWSKTQKIVMSANTNSVEINSALKDLKDKILNIYIEAKEKGKIVNAQYFKEALIPKAETLEDAISDDLMTYIDMYLKQAELKAKNKELSKETLKSYNTLKNKIKGFQEYKKIKFKVQDVDLLFYNEFKRYSLEVKKLSIGTFGNDINRLKTAIITAKEEYKLKVSEDIFSSRFKRTRGKTVFVTLNEDELLQIIQHDLTKTPYLDNARDWIIIGCYVGQRVTDLLSLTTKNITSRKGREYIEFTQSKTDKTITLPIHGYVEATLAKNQGQFPRKITPQKLNEYIKLVCKEVGLTQQVEGSKTNPKTKRKENGTYEKWELIVSHDFRRSFASNHYGKLPTPVIMKLTGHTTEAIFLKYINREETQDADIMAEYWDKLPEKKNPNLKIITL
jgi:integrase